MLARVGFAAAQGAQNPVCFSLIPELFPVNKSTALSLYNCAIYVGRALSFAAVLLARHLHDNDQVGALEPGAVQGGRGRGSRRRLCAGRQDRRGCGGDQWIAH